MGDLTKLQNDLQLDGFLITNGIYSDTECKAIADLISRADQTGITFRKTDDLFAIRRLLKEVPELKPLIFNQNLKHQINSFFGNECFVVKSIYFDKPEKSNWFVAWHQDLTISVDKKIELTDYGPWTTKLNQFTVQPPLSILQNNFTIRIHLDNTDESNGALKVIPSTHNEVIRSESIGSKIDVEIFCPVNAGGIMIMRPLLMHASNRTTSNKQRRVIHIEFSSAQLPAGVNWSERDLIPTDQFY